MADGVAKQRIVPLQLTRDLLGVGVYQQFVGVEAMSVCRIVGAMHAIAIQRARPGVGQVAVPDLVGEFRQGDALDFCLAIGIEQAQFNLGGIGRKDREVDARAVPRRTQRIGQAFTDAAGGTFCA